jgi:uncharacterized membrane protein
MKRNNHVRFLVEGAIIAALYTVLTYVAAAMNLAYQSVQFRFSEMLTILPVFTPAAVPGLTIGCFLSNLASPLGIVDWIFGTTASLLAAIFTRMLRKIQWKGIPFLAILPPVIFNALVVGIELACLSESGTFSFANMSLAGFWAGALSVGIGELAVCVVLGLPLMIVLYRMRFQERILLQK